MTSLWDKLGREAYNLMYNNPWDLNRAQKLMRCMDAIYLSIKDREEYQKLTISFKPDLNLLITLRDNVNFHNYLLQIL